MAKRTNIIRMLKSEIDKGNTIILPNGNFVNEEYLLGDILKSFTDDLKNGKIDMSETPDNYRNKKLSECIKATDVLKQIETIIGTPAEQEQETTEPVKEVIENGAGKADVNNGGSRKNARGGNKDRQKANA